MATENHPEVNEGAEPIPSGSKWEQVAKEAEAATQDMADELANLSFDQLKARMLEVEAKLADSQDKLLRQQADAENAKRRAHLDLEKAHKYGVQKLLQDLLPVLDSLERSLETEGIQEGVQLTLKMLQDVLAKFGLKSVNPMGEAFNPDFHEAMTAQPSAEHAPNTVITVLQKGYVLHERLVRPALVVVAKAP